MEALVAAARIRFVRVDLHQTREVAVGAFERNEVVGRAAAVADQTKVRFFPLDAVGRGRVARIRGVLGLVGARILEGVDGLVPHLVHAFPFVERRAHALDVVTVSLPLPRLVAPDDGIERRLLHLVELAPHVHAVGHDRIVQEQLPVAADPPWRVLTRRRGLDSAGLRPSHIWPPDGMDPATIISRRRPGCASSRREARSRLDTLQPAGRHVDRQRLPRVCIKGFVHMKAVREMQVIFQDDVIAKLGLV